MEPTLPNDPDELYTLYKQDPKTVPINKVVKSLEPQISYALASAGAASNPHLKHQAKLVVADAIDSYQPGSGANLTTWTANQLQRMRRSVREQSRGGMKVPDRVILDAMHIHNKTQEYIDKYNREPDTHELADFSGFSTQRIEKVRKIGRPSVTEGVFGDDGGSATQSTDYTDEAVDYFLQGADPVDRKIFEWRTGYKGQKILPTTEIARRLNLTPAALTKRGQRISYRLQGLLADLEKTFS